MNSISVVIVEDDHKIAEIQARFLERLPGFDVVGIAHSLVDAKDIVEVFRPELVLLDVFFPDGNGLDFLRDLRASELDIDVILITAAKEVEVLKSAMHGGVFDYILKPLVFDRFKNTLAKFSAHLEKLEDLSAIAQTDVDRLLSGGGASKQNIHRLPKGIDALTLDGVRAIFSQPLNNAISAEEAGSRLGVSRTTARRYLEYLVSTEEVLASINYGNIGRPERRYQPNRDLKGRSTKAEH